MYLFLNVHQFAASENSTSVKYRSPKQALFSVVNFPNEACSGTNGLNGTCLSSSECIGSGGKAKGSCAMGFGTCCFFTMDGCGGMILRNQTYLFNPNFPSPYTVSGDETCTWEITRINSDICQLRFDFDRFELGGPSYPGYNFYECDKDNTDYVTFNPAGNRANGIILCGYNPGQHVYIDMGGPTAEPATASMVMTFDATTQSEFERYYQIMVSQIECGTPYTPPRGCDQYYFGNGGAGVVQSYNYDQPLAKYVAKLKGYYSVCIRQEEGMCVIGYTPPDVDVEPLGFSVSGGTAFERARVGCFNPQPTGCGEEYVRIPQGTINTDGSGPYSPDGTISCDRYCGKRFCTTRNDCLRGDHQTIYSKSRPFNMFVEFNAYGPIPTRELKGYKLNYFQLPC